MMLRLAALALAGAAPSAFAAEDGSMDASLGAVDMFIDKIKTTHLAEEDM